MNVITLDSLANQTLPSKKDRKPPPSAEHKVMDEIKASKKDSIPPYFTYNANNQLIEVDHDSPYGHVNRLLRELKTHNCLSPPRLIFS